MIHKPLASEVPDVAWSIPGDDFIVETYDWTAASSRTTIPRRCARHRSVDRDFLSGPNRVKGASRRLLVSICSDVGPDEGKPVGASTAFSQARMERLLTDISRWRRSRFGISRHVQPIPHIPGVNFAVSSIRPDRCLPDPKLWRPGTSVRGVIATKSDASAGSRQPAVGPDAHMGRLTGEAKDKAALRRAHRAAARAWRQLRYQGPVTRSRSTSRVCAGGPVSRCDLHFSQATARSPLRRDRDGRLAAYQSNHQDGVSKIRHQESRVQAVAGDAELQGYLIFEGISVDEQGSSITSTSISPTGRPA